MQLPFLKAVPLLEAIETAGFDAYFVGGSVRDSLLNRKIADVDIATSALPAELKKIFPRTVDLGIEHGTILVLYNGVPYEITTFRTESQYTDHRRPDNVEFIRSLNEDLKRRDFTMNAMAMDKTGNIIDPFHGTVSISDQQIKTVGKASDRFGEDALRIMRALRFVSQLGFSIEHGTFAALKKQGHLLESIAVERKTAEFEKLLAGKYVSKALPLLLEAGIHSYLPGLAGKKKCLNDLARCGTAGFTIEEMWSLLLYFMNLNDQEAEDFLRKWKLPVKKMKHCIYILKWLDFRQGDNWDAESAYHSGKSVMLSAERIFHCLAGEEAVLDKLEALFDSLPIKNSSELDVNGNDLISWFDRKPGPWIKEAVSDIEKAVLLGKVRNTKAEIKEWLLKCNQSSGKD